MNTNINTNTKHKIWIIPLVMAVIMLILALMIFGQAAANDNAEDGFLPFVGHAGTFRYNNVYIFGVSLYTAMHILGMIVGFVFAIFLRGRFSMSLPKLMIVAVIYYIQAIYGAKLLFAVQTCMRREDFTHWDFGGLSVYGAFFSTILLTPLIALIVRVKIKNTYDLVAFLSLIFLSFSRTGCYFAGCCGTPLTFVNDHPVHFPIQLIEVSFDFAILALCLWYNGQQRTPGKKYVGMFPLLYLCYTPIRFILEFWRTNPVTKLGITEAQIHSVILFAGALVMVALTKPEPEVSESVQ